MTRSHQLTAVSIEQDDFLINGQVTYPGRRFRGGRVEGLLLNSRMVQGIFDDANGETRSLWDYPDGAWDADRNTREFVRHMPTWQACGLNSFTLNLQGGSPFGYSREQPWRNSAFTPEGELQGPYMDRLRLILDRADDLGMAVILGFFYFGQFAMFESEADIVNAVDNATDWILAQGYAHVLVEIGNETDITRTPYGYGTSPVCAARCHELIRRVQERSAGRVHSPAGRLLCSTSLKGASVPEANLMKAADFLLLHGNGVDDPDRIADMVRSCRRHSHYKGQPILFNEDDHYRFGEPWNNMSAAAAEHAGWGFFDYRREGEDWNEGFQSVPVDWSIGSDRKRTFFRLVSEMAGVSP